MPHQQKLNEQQWGIPLAISKKNKKTFRKKMESFHLDEKWPPWLWLHTPLVCWRVFDRTWIIVSLVGRNYSSSVDFDIFLSSWCDHSTNQKYILKRFIKSWLKQNTLKYESIQFLWRFENCFEQLSKNTKATRIFMCGWFLSRSYSRTIRKNQKVWMIFCARQKTWGWWSF